MRVRPWIKFSVLALAVSAGLHAPAFGNERSQLQPALLEVAKADYERNSWQSAFASLAQLADGGHAEAARIALLMARNGQALYGQDFGVSRPRLATWTELASQAGMASAEPTGEPWRYHCKGSSGSFVLIKDSASGPWTAQPAKERGTLPLDVRADIGFNGNLVDAQGKFQIGEAALSYHCAPTRED